MRAHVIVNRRARRLVLPSPLLAELCRARAGVQTVETTTPEELDAVARSLALTNPEDTVVLAGGDGSGMTGVSAIVRAWGETPLPPIALAPGGTVGTVARNWGKKGDPVRSVARLLDAIVHDDVHVTSRPSLRVAEAGGQERVGFIFGAGLVARFFERYDARGARGNIDAARITLRVFAGSFVGSPFARSVLDPVECALTVDGRPAPFDRVSLLCASVVRDLGLGMRLTHRAGEELDRFHVIATPLGPRALGPQMPLVLAARPLIGPKVDDLARELVLRFETGRGAYVLDGELLRADAITVTPGPVLRVLSAATT